MASASLQAMDRMNAAAENLDSRHPRPRDRSFWIARRRASLMERCICTLTEAVQDAENIWKIIQIRLQVRAPTKRQRGAGPGRDGNIVRICLKAAKIWPVSLLEQQSGILRIQHGRLFGAKSGLVELYLPVPFSSPNRFRRVRSERFCWIVKRMAETEGLVLLS